MTLDNSHGNQSSNMEEQLSSLQQLSSSLFRGGEAHEIALRIRSKALANVTQREKQRSVIHRKARPLVAPSSVSSDIHSFEISVIDGCLCAIG